MIARIKITVPRNPPVPVNEEDRKPESAEKAENIGSDATDIGANSQKAVSQQPNSPPSDEKKPD